MRLTFAKSSEMTGRGKVAFSVWTFGSISMLLIVTQIWLAPLLGVKVVHTPLWAGLCGGLGSALAQVLARVRLVV